MLNQSQFIQVFYGAGISKVLSLGAITELGNSYDEGGAFSYCQNLTAVTLPSTLTILNQVQFQYSPNFHTLTIPASVATIKGYWSVIGRSQITELICLGETPPTVTSTSFTSAAGLQSIKVPASASDIYIKQQPSGVIMLVSLQQYNCFTITR